MKRMAVCLVLGVCFGGLLAGCGEGGRGVAEGEAGPMRKFVFTVDGQHFDLGDGRYLVAMLSAVCDHCRASVPELNELMFAGALPPLVALMLGSQEEVEEFTMLTAPLFPMHRVEPLDFMQFIRTEPPRLIYCVDGHVAESWEWLALEDFPGLEAILAGVGVE